MRCKAHFERGGWTVWMAVMAAAWLAGWPATAQGTTIFVKADAPGANNGTSWADAFRQVQPALDAAVGGDEVWVAAGTYVENITLKLGVALYGGFAGNETGLSQRNWATNKTILDGSQAGSVVTSPLDATGTTRIDGFTIRNGLASHGGGLYCSFSSPTIANNTITNNIASLGGGIDCSTSSPTIINNTLTTNAASDKGGGLRCVRSWPRIQNNVINGNTAGHGGGIFCDGFSGAMITNNTVISNSAWGTGGGIGSANSSPTIANTIVAFNSSGIFSLDGDSLTLRHNCAYANAGNNYYGMTDPTGTNGNISVDPKVAGWRYGHWHVESASPCVGAGDNALVPPDTADLDGDGDSTEPLPFDLDGQPRTQGQNGIVDIGADESDGIDPPGGPNVIVRVSLDGDDANDGSSWALAKRTVQTGINTASALGGEVWVKAGTYPERIRLGVFVHMYGGFNGTEATRSQRDFRSNVTVLDGQQGGSVVTVPVGHDISTIDGFTIRNGRTSSGVGGGGIRCVDSSPVIANNTITGNTAQDGGGIYCANGHPTIVDNAIHANTAANGAGGGIYCLFASPATIANNTITGNRTTGTSSYDGGGGICCYYSSPTVANTIIAFNSSGIYRYGAYAPVLRYNCVFGNTTYNYSGIPDPTGTYGNISAEPLFVRPANPGPDSQWGTADDDCGDLRLQPGSPCIDAGDNTVVPADTLDLDGDGNTTEPMPLDLAGIARFLDDPLMLDTGLGTPPIVDMGAYEHVPTAPADFDDDGDVDADDLTAFQACASGPGVPMSSGCRAKDLDRDDDVDQSDFGIFQRCLSGADTPATLNCGS